MKSRFTAKGLALLAILVVGLYGCNMGGDGTGSLSLSLTDKPTHDYKEVWVTIQDVWVHAESDTEGSWTKILDVNRTVDLLTLSNGVRLELGMVELSSKSARSPLKNSRFQAPRMKKAPLTSQRRPTPRLYEKPEVS